MKKKVYSLYVRPKPKHAPLLLQPPRRFIGDMQFTLQIDMRDAIDQARTALDNLGSIADAARHVFADLPRGIQTGLHPMTPHLRGIINDLAAAEERAAKEQAIKEITE